MTRLSIGEAIQQVVHVVSNVGDTGEVLATIARTARQMMSSDEAYLLLREGGRLVLRAADGLPHALVGKSYVRAGEGIEGWVADHGEAVALSDASRERRFRDLPGRETQVHSLAVVPMRLRDDVVGVLATAGMDPFPPAGSRLTGLEILASIAAVTIENDRLLAQERRRAHQAEVLLELATIQDPELGPFLRRVADAINSSMGADDTELVLLDEKGREVVRAGRANAASAGSPSGYTVSTSPSEDWAVRVLDSGAPLLCEDVALDPRLSREFGPSVRSLLAVPIHVQGQRRGVLRVATAEPGSFLPHDLAFVTLIATQVGLSLERADLARRQLEISREQARQQARQDFLGTVSHELKTPVAVFKAYTELLQRRAEIAPERASDAEVLDRMLEQADRMLAMIEHLLDLQKIEAGQLPLEFGHFDLIELAKKVAESLQLTAQSHKVALRACGRLLVIADRRRIEEVLFNLGENAVKYSPEGGRITMAVETRRGDGNAEEAIVSVADEGAGILPADLPHIFERFYQARGRLHRGHVGLGLGLYIAREIITRHGGAIWAESADGEGSTFYFTLPMSGLRTED